jgi:hypothetical protein
MDPEPFLPFLAQRAHHRKVIVERGEAGSPRIDRMADRPAVAPPLNAELRLEFPATGVECEIDAPLA